MRKLKSVIYGTIPYYFSLLFNPGSESIPYFRYIHEQGYAHHLYFFGHEYREFKTEVHEDPEKDLWYVIHKGEKLYFPKNRSCEKVAGLYKALVMEQDPRSPHCYIRDIQEVKDRIFFDIGAAEGLIALEVIELVRTVYLFECETEWIKALEATFAPWKEKVRIIHKYIGDCNDGPFLTLDHFFQDKLGQPVFLKMDIEGMERKALKGAEKLFSETPDLKFAVCAYHLSDDEKVISTFLKNCHVPYCIQRGYVNKRVRAVMFRDKVL